MISRTRWTAAVVAVLALGVAALPGPASAATVTSLSCESGDAQLMCEVNVGGRTYGLDPAIRWTVGGSSLPAFDNLTALLRSCRAGSRVAVTVWVGDPLASQDLPYEEDTRTVTVLCRRFWQ